MVNGFAEPSLRRMALGRHGRQTNHTRLNADNGRERTMKQGAASSLFFIEPMMAFRSGDLPAGNWIYELKFDGYRALAFKAGKEVRLVYATERILTTIIPHPNDRIGLPAGPGMSGGRGNLLQPTSYSEPGNPKPDFLHRIL
jgi:hypothetical protein